jgi:DNA invertase Pin-like site-specific DNA recombinase
MSSGTEKAVDEAREAAIAEITKCVEGLEFF